MKCALIFFLLIFHYWANAQSFELKESDTTRIKGEIKNLTGEFHDVIYIYLQQNYKQTSEKLEVKKYDFVDYTICSFKQSFENRITYWTNHCQEAGGISTILTLPKTNRQNLVKWIEMVYRCESNSDSANIWNKEKTKFKPKEPGAGCYYEIKETNINTIVESYCGC